MTDSDISALKNAVALASTMGSFVAWAPEGECTCRKVTRVGSASLPADPEDEPEPSEVAYIESRGDYVALYNADLSDFIVATRLGKGAVS